MNYQPSPVAWNSCCVEGKTKSSAKEACVTMFHPHTYFCITHFMRYRFLYNHCIIARNTTADNVTIWPFLPDYQRAL